MHIKEITLDGFKSYGKRVDIKGFDPLFNAITGLNGSGKSNILDGICFVLGISNLTQVRAGNLQDLVYKFGQAGITKASVSITFDNTDKTTSPIGYENCNEIVVTRQVVVGGKNRYLINGLNMNNKRVQDLFRSLQLNVNNPTFLIMQGRITKVLNMKPQEILGMIEEAAGTKMYEHKKLAALNTIDKKNAKLQEIDQVLADTINPTIDKLKKERNMYLEYQSVQRNLQHMRRLHVMHKYCNLKEVSTAAAASRERIQTDLDEATSKMADADKKIEEMDNLIKDIETKRQQEPASKLAELQGAWKEKEREETVKRSEVKTARESLKDDEKRLQVLKKNLAAEENGLNSRQKAHENMSRNWEAVKAQVEADEKALEAAQIKVEQASRGNVAGDETSLRSQLDEAKAEYIHAKTAAEQASISIAPMKASLKKKEGESKRTQGDYEKSAASKQKLVNEIETMKRKLASLNYDAAAADQLEGERNRLTREISKMRDHVDCFDDRYPRFAFTFSSPQPNFDRRRVRGVVAKLFDVIDSKYMQAIEIASGARLFHVVVDTEQTGKLLLDKGCLQRRVTFIPLNKISGYEIDQKTVETARRIVGGEKVWRALDLVRYDADLSPAMIWLFGSQLICESMEVAKVVSYHPRIMRRCVTLEGDVFDPSGTLSGGARERGQDLLESTSQFRRTVRDLSIKEEELRQMDQQIGSPEVARQYKSLSEAIEMKTYELNAMNQRLAATDHHKHLEELEYLRQQLKEQEEIALKSKADMENHSKKMKGLEDMLKNLDKLRDQGIKEAKKNLAECEKRAKAAAARAAGMEDEAQQFEVEVEAAKKEIADLKTKIEELEKKIEDTRNRIPQMEEAVKDAQVDCETAKQAVAHQRELLAAADKEVQRANSEKKVAAKVKSDLKLKIQKLDHDLKGVDDRGNHADELIEELCESNEWLRAEMDKLERGLAQMEVDLGQSKDVERGLAKLEEKEKKLSRNVNVKAMNMLGHMEEKFTGLVKKKEQVESDKRKIQKFIDDLDQKKNEVLEAAHKQVDRDFGSIFSELLPGARAKLVPPQGKSVLEGLEVKVAFGEVWKESLAELSGGQRSLVALSLILAILLFKPAPLYILDEVDAALDLSHTQNIGSMLKKHFQHSQFIVVSLKEGMFSNANVLFKTKFEDGMSTVIRKPAHH